MRTLTNLKRLKKDDFAALLDEIAERDELLFEADQQLCMLLNELACIKELLEDDGYDYVVNENIATCIAIIDELLLGDEE